MQNPPSRPAKLRALDRLLGNLGYEVSHDLTLHGQSRLIFNSILTQLYGPLEHSP